jgi:hypothetical protein
MVECPFELDCLNVRSVKCQVCVRISEKSGHHPAFKDKVYYSKSLPIIPNLKRIFESDF